jgi:hypothetical protein
LTDKLYFNGVNGATGAYGLPPMSAEALAERVLRDRYGAMRQLRDLQRELTLRTTHERKILGIVEFLVKDVVGLLCQAPAQAGRELELQDAWYRDTASRLLTILFAGQGRPLPGDVQVLAHRLRQEPVETIARIVRLLGSGQGAVLAQWLLNHDAANPATLRSSLESRFDQALIALRKTYLSDEGQGVVDGQGIIRAQWIEEFKCALDQLPVDSLRVLPGVDAIAGPLRTLVHGLGTLDGLRDEGAFRSARAPSEPRQQLAALSVADAFDSWHEVVASLRGVLIALRRARQPLVGGDLSGAIRAWLDELRRSVTGQLGTVPWVDPKKIEQTGWGIVFPALMPEDRCQAIQKALLPLLSLRQRQAGPLYRVYAGRHGYRPGDTASTFLRRPPRNADAANPADPRTTGVPYYLLLVGNPEEIPFEFQYQLDVQYAVGRLDFGGDLAAYHNYATNVAAVEDDSGAPPPSARRGRAASSFVPHQEATAPSTQVVFFGTEHSGDTATVLSARHLVAPLAQHFRAQAVGSPRQVVHIDPKKATKANLLGILQLTPPPALLFAATHGIELAPDDPRQRELQGSLICQDWSARRGALTPESYVSAADLATSKSSNLKGMIVFLFACFGAGTPQVDEYHRHEFKAHAAPIAPTPFVAALPKAMLSLKDRGALAVIGHVERAWGLSFLADLTGRPETMDGRKREHVEVFASVIDRLLDGHPVGSAMDYMNMRHAALATELTYLYDRMAEPPSSEDLYRLAELWTANNDARGYIVVGDPAVRLSGTLSA